MKRAFKLEKGVEVVKCGRVYDLHNDYVPTAIIFDIVKGDLRFVFERLVSDKVAKSLSLVFRSVDILELSGNMAGSALAGLDEMGFKAVDDYDYDWLSTEGQSRSSDHMVLRFDDGATIRVHGAHADIVEESNLRSLQGHTI